MHTRRQFLHRVALMSALANVSLKHTVKASPPAVIPASAYTPPALPATITPFTEVLPNYPAIVTYGAAAASLPKLGSVPLVELAARQGKNVFHAGFPNATTCWGYSAATDPNPGYLGPTIIASRGSKIKFHIRNLLPATHLFPVDSTLMGVTDMVPNPNGAAGTTIQAPACRVSTHLHGGHVAPQSDGHPEAWVGPEQAGLKQIQGLQFSKDPMQGVIYDYPNDVSARLMWYHDHSLGITRLNAYAGLAAGYYITDSVDQALFGTVPLIPLVIQDKAFTPDGLSIWYPTQPDPASLAYTPVAQGGAGILTNPATGLAWDPLPNPSCVPEHFGNCNLVNGKVWPKLTVDPKQYRFLILNGANARFFNMRLFYYDPVAKTILPNGGGQPTPGPAFVQIGNEAGFLNAPIYLNDPADPFGNSLLLAPAERADILIDFSLYAGQTFVLWNNAPAPFPGGSVDPGCQPIMLIQVNGTPVGQLTPPLPVLPVLPGVSHPAVTACTTTRELVLNEDFDNYGRLIQRMGLLNRLANGTGVPTPPLGYRDLPITELVKNNTYELWKIWNLTGDTHPIHIHLCNFQMVSYQEFAMDFKTPLAPLQTPPDNESDWKETLRIQPGRFDTIGNQLTVGCTTLIAKFSGSSTWAGTAGEYMWHCHILEHEEHDMMRRFKLTP